MVYHLAYKLDGVSKTVKNSDEHRALGPEWFEGPDGASAAFDIKPRQEQWDILLRSKNAAVGIDRFYKKLFDSAPGREKLDIARDYRDQHPHLAVNSEWAKPYLTHLSPSASLQRAGSGSGELAGERVAESGEEELNVAQAASTQESPTTSKSPKREQKRSSLPERRAITVATIIKELDILEPQLHHESDYERLKREKSEFLTFRETEKRRDLKELLLNIQDHRRYIRLAQQLAASHHGVRLDTIKTDWKKHKPAEFRRQ